MDSSRNRANPNWLLMLGVGLLVGGLLVAGSSWTNPLSEVFGSGEVEVDQGPVVVQSVRNLSELSTVEVVQSTTVEAGIDSGMFNFATGDQLFLFAVAKISAGVDLSHVGSDDVFVNEDDNSIRLRLPPPEVTSVEVDNEQTRVYDRETGLFTSGDIDLERAARQSAEDTMLEAALQEGLLEQAEASTELAMEELLTSMGYDDVTVVFNPAAG